MLRFAMLSLVGVVAFGVTSEVRADRIYVDGDVATAGAGVSWGDAISDLATALDRARAGDEIWVREGRYVVPSSMRSFRIPSGVQLYGGFAGTESELSERSPAQHPTILDGDRLANDGFGDFADNASPVLLLESSSAETRVDGVVIHGGFARAGVRPPHGGGVVVDSGSPTFCRVVFQSNRTGSGTLADPSAGSGGALWITGSGEVTVSDCEFRSNRAGDGYAPPGVSGPSGSGGGGGAIGVRDATLFLENTILWDNSAGSGGAGEYPGHGGHGGAIHAERALVIVRECEFVANAAGSGGDSFGWATVQGGSGGAIFGVDATIEIDSCEFRDQLTGPSGLANIPQPSGHGGALALWRGSVRCFDSLFRNNRTATGALGSRESGATGDGGAIWAADALEVMLIGCTLEANRTGTSEPGFIVGGASGSGGAVALASIERASFAQTRFLRNRTGDGAPADEALGGLSGSGGAVAASFSAVSVVQCAFLGNETGNGGDADLFEGGAAGNGGAVSVWLGSIDVVQSTIVGNRAGAGGAGPFDGSDGLCGGVHVVASAGSVRDTILYGNLDESGLLEAGQIVGIRDVEASCVEGWSQGPGALAVDPQFVDPFGPDGVIGTHDDRVDLSATSPLIDVGSGVALGADLWDLDGDGDASELWSLDLGGEERRLDDVFVAGVISGTPPIDIGAYEYQAPCTAPLTDVIGDAVEVCEGSELVLDSGVIGTLPVSYQWRRDGVDLPGHNGSVFIIPAVEATDLGVYTVVAGNECGTEEFIIGTLTAAPACPPQFIRGDSDLDGRLTLIDIVVLLEHIAFGRSVDCEAALDANDNETIELSDAITLATFLYGGGAPPSAPYPECGPDPTPLECPTTTCP